MKKEKFLKRMGTALKQMRTDRLADTLTPEHPTSWEYPGINMGDPDSQFVVDGRNQIGRMKANARAARTFPESTGQRGRRQC